MIFGFNIPRNQIVRLLHVMNKEHDHNIIFPHFDLLLFEIHKFKSQSKKIIDPTSYVFLFLLRINLPKLLIELLTNVRRSLFRTLL